MNTEAPKEENEEWNPSQILDQSPEEASMSNTVLQESIAKVSNARENDRAGQENLETVKIKSIHLDSESEEEIINDGPDRRGSNPIVREHVGHHPDLVVDWRLGPNETP